MVKLSRTRHENGRVDHKYLGTFADFDAAHAWLSDRHPIASEYHTTHEDDGSHSVGIYESRRSYGYVIEQVEEGK